MVLQCFFSLYEQLFDQMKLSRSFSVKSFFELVVGSILKSLFFDGSSSFLKRNRKPSFYNGNILEIQGK